MPLSVEDRIAREFPGVSIVLGRNEKSGYVYLARLYVDRKKRGQGLATKAMNRLHELVDEPIELMPCSGWGSNLKRLKNFYKRFGYKDVPTKPGENYRMRREKC